MKIAFYGSSLLSSYWNGAATYYRGLIRALAGCGYDVTFHEPRFFGRHDRRDIAPPSWCGVEVFSPTLDGVKRAATRAAEADIVVKASGVGVFDNELLDATMAAARPDALRIWWDVDAPATLADIETDPSHPLRDRLAELDAVLTYGGGDSVVASYQALGARTCRPIYNALDPATHHPAAPDARFSGDLGFLGNRLPDREARVREYFLEPAAAAPDLRFVLGGAGWVQDEVPANVRVVGHVPTQAHNAFNASPRAVLNVSRESMAARGFSPATRVFEAAGAGACLITDAWDGIDRFLTPGEEIIVVRDGRDLVECLAGLSVQRARQIAAMARARVLREHTYRHRAAEADAVFRQLLRQKRREAAA